MDYDVSVVVATFNRGVLLRALLDDLSVQNMQGMSYEVVVVDDGSDEPVSAWLTPATYPYPLTVHRQSNQGASAARHAGIVCARGRVMVLLDDDMRVEKDFLHAHAMHHSHQETVVLGKMKASDRLQSMPVFEKFHAFQLDAFEKATLKNPSHVKGVHLCTGNVSFSKALYERVGGFDVGLSRSEDRELGVRFEKEGCVFVYEPLAQSCHESDHSNPHVWLRRAYLYGVYDRRIAHKHPEVESANPWRFLWQVNPLSKPLLVASAVQPVWAEKISTQVLKCAMWLDGQKRPMFARAATTLAYGMRYFAGVRNDAGSLLECSKDFLNYCDKRLQTHPSDQAFVRMCHAIRMDYGSVQRYRYKYKQHHVPLSSLPKDAVKKVGFQMTLALRWMQCLHHAGLGLQAQVVSRMIRHVYGADIHWEASIEPGVSVVHGMGLVISPRAHVSRGCILFQHVTLGEGIDAESRQTGAPFLEEDVHVGPGCTLLGPIVIGKGSKIMAGSVVTSSVPAYSVVKPSAVHVEPRRRISHEKNSLRKDTRTSAHV
jgi:serine acetyltransferase/GT2 family glycosyltransferase